MLPRKTVAAIAAASAISLAVAGCNGSSTANPSTTTKPTLTLAVIAPAQTFLAKDMPWGTQSPFAQAVYDTLLRADTSGKVIPGLATEWKYNDNRTVLTLTLRSGVTFSDGSKLNADAAAQNLLRFRDGTSANKSFLASLKDAKAIDDTRLELTLTDSDPALLIYLTQNAGLVQAPSSFDNSDATTRPVGSGPFILDTANTVVGSTYKFTANPNYWEKASQPYDKLALNIYPDKTATLNAIKGRQISASSVTNDNVDQVKGAGYNVVSAEGGGWTGLILFDRAGKLNPALKDVRVRQAINYAFDRQGLMQALVAGQGKPTTQVLHATSPGYDASLDSRYPYDPAKAKALLAEAGYSNGFTLEMPRAAFLPGPVFTLVQQQLKDVGITVNYVESGNNFLPDVLAAKFAATVMSLPADPDWQLIKFQLTPTSTFNPTKYEDPKVTALIKRYHDAANESEATPVIKELNTYIVEQAWFAPWYRPTSYFAVDANTTVQMQPGNAYPYLWNFKPKS
jgi:peptide/nickel transport system substrate-binding protein